LNFRSNDYFTGTRRNNINKTRKEKNGIIWVIPGAASAICTESGDKSEQREMRPWHVKVDDELLSFLFLI
jgi:hypothetical protein